MIAMQIAVCSGDPQALANHPVRLDHTDRLYGVFKACCAHNEQTSCSDWLFDQVYRMDFSSFWAAHANDERGNQRRPIPIGLKGNLTTNQTQQIKVPECVFCVLFVRQEARKWTEDCTWDCVCDFNQSSGFLPFTHSMLGNAPAPTADNPANQNQC